MTTRRVMMVVFNFVAAAALAAPPTGKPAPAAEAPLGPQYETRALEGWTLHINTRLLDPTRKDQTEQAVNLLKDHLAHIVKVVPAPAVAELRKVPLWFSPEYDGIGPRAEYHPAAAWLKSHGRDPAMAKGVEFTNVRTFKAETDRMPVFVLHELAHAYHDRVLGFDRADVKSCYELARSSKSYDAVERWNGPGRKVTRERAYAMTDAKEYFAECTEAYFGRNDFYPFTRADLEKHDPDMAKLLGKLWAGPVNDQPRRGDKQ